MSAQFVVHFIRWVLSDELTDCYSSLCTANLTVFALQLLTMVRLYQAGFSYYRFSESIQLEVLLMMHVVQCLARYPGLLRVPNIIRAASLFQYIMLISAVVYLQFRNGGAARFEVNFLPEEFKQNIDNFYHQQTLATTSTALLLILLPLLIMISPHTTIGNFLASVLVAGSGIRAACYHADIIAHFEPFTKESESTFEYEHILGIGAVLLPLYQFCPFSFTRSVRDGGKRRYERLIEEIC